MLDLAQRLDRDTGLRGDLDGRAITASGPQDLTEADATFALLLAQRGSHHDCNSNACDGKARIVIVVVSIEAARDEDAGEVLTVQRARLVVAPALQGMGRRWLLAVEQERVAETLTLVHLEKARS